MGLTVTYSESTASAFLLNVQVMLTVDFFMLNDVLRREMVTKLLQSSSDLPMTLTSFPRYSFKT